MFDYASNRSSLSRLRLITENKDARAWQPFSFICKRHIFLENKNLTSIVEAENYLKHVWQLIISTLMLHLRYPRFAPVENGLPTEKRELFLTYIHFHNILRLFEVLPNFPFTTSEMMRDCYLQTWYIREYQESV